MKKTHQIIVASLTLCAFGLLACNDQISDPSFQSWCGDTLCDWEVEAGSIARVGTWHPQDYGVELVATPTILSQVTGDPTSGFLARGLDVDAAELEAACDDIGGIYVPEENDCFALLSNGNSRCVSVNITADVEAGAQVQIEMDYGADGTVDATHAMTASRWEPVSFLTSLPAWPGMTRFRLHKRGEGRVRIANFGVTPATDCVDEVVVEERPLGVSCEDESQCAGGVCATVASWQACSECAQDAECGAGNECAVVWDDEHPNGAYRACRTVQ